MYPKKTRFKTPKEQEAYILKWTRERVGFAPRVKIAWYPGRYATDKGSIMPVGDITLRVPKGSRDVAILEEPEHLCWYHPGRGGRRDLNTSSASFTRIIWSTREERRAANAKNRY